MQIRTDIAARAVERVATETTRETSRHETTIPRPSREIASRRPATAERGDGRVEQFEEIEVDAQLVGIIMGSKNDKDENAAGGEGPERSRGSPARCG